MRECECEQPVARGATPNRPNDDERCVKCGLYLNPDWTTNQQTFDEFFERLEEGMFPAAVLYGTEESRQVIRPAGPPRWFNDFRDECEARFLAGQDHFGLRFLSRDNALEAREEATDAANYSWMALLRQRREGDQEEWALALTAAEYAAKLHETLVALGRHRHRAFSDPTS